MRVRTVLLEAVALLLVVASVSVSPAYAASPTVTLQPGTSLIDRQVITVSGAGFTPSTTVRVSECLASDVTRCAVFTEAFPSTDASGNFAYTFAVRREIQVTPNSAEITDCATVPGGCVFFAVNFFNASEHASAPISFDPKVRPLRVKPTVDRKATLTNDGFTVAVSGKAWCTVPATIGITGFIQQDARDPNSGYPFNTFVNCVPRRSSWSATIQVSAADVPFLEGKADVQVIMIATTGGPQVATLEQVVLKER